MASTLLFLATTCLFLGMSLVALWHLRWVGALPRTQPAPPSGAANARPTTPPPPRCSVVIAARNEESRIEETIRRLLAQTGVDLELIVVDDRSTDRTRALLGQLARQDPRLIVKTVDTLPAGWLGKCHACHLGATTATSEWILFTDADCWFNPDLAYRAISALEATGADHLTLAPGTVLENPWARAWHLLFLTSLVNWFSGVNRDRPGAHLGIGAFNLVRADTYRRSGGYEALRLTVVDDLKLGLLVRRAGGKTRGYLGIGELECHWGHTVGAMIRIMEKNYFAVTNYNTGVVAAGTAAALTLFSLPFLGLLSGSVPGLLAFASPLFLSIPGAMLAHRLGWSRASALLIPLMLPVFLYALLNSTVVTLRQGGIRWRDTFYPLAELRAANVQ